MKVFVVRNTERKEEEKKGECRGIPFLEHRCLTKNHKNYKRKEKIEVREHLKKREEREKHRQSSNLVHDTLPMAKGSGHCRLIAR